jgi:hypothetical protein
MARLADLLGELARLSKKILGGVGDCWFNAATFETNSVIVKSRRTRTKSCYAFAKSNSLATESTSIVVRLSSIATESIFIAAESSYDVGGSCFNVTYTDKECYHHVQWVRRRSWISTSEVEHPLCVRSTLEPNLEPRNRRGRVRPSRAGKREALSVEARTKWWESEQ